MKNLGFQEKGEKYPAHRRETGTGALFINLAIRAG